jgi:hypothetical protein
MVIIPLTLIVSLSLVFTFVVYFIAEQRRVSRGGSERDSLMPLQEEARIIERRHPAIAKNAPPAA